MSTLTLSAAAVSRNQKQESLAWSIMDYTAGNATNATPKVSKWNVTHERTRQPMLQLLSKLFPPELPMIDIDELIDHDAQSNDDSGVVGSARLRPYRDRLDRMQKESQ